MNHEPCDTILFNGKIATVDDDFSVAQAVAIRNGKFIMVGGDAQVRSLAGRDTRDIDLQGRTVVPGFIDTHPHMLHAAMGMSISLPLFGLSSIEEIKRRISEEVQKKSPGQWIVTSPVGQPPYYFNVPGILKEKRWPNRWDLDEVSPENPVYLSAAHSRVPNTGVLNSYGLKLLGVTKETPADQQGVTIVKDHQTGEPTGELQGMQQIYNLSPLFGKLFSMLPRPRPDDIENGLRAAIRMRHAAGVTTVYEGHYVSDEHLSPLKTMWSRGEQTMRVCFAYEIDAAKSLGDIESFMKRLVHASGSGSGDDMLKICGITLSLDGPIWHGLALMNEPYLGPYGKMTTGMQLVSTDKFKQIALMAARHNLRLNSCFGGDKAADITLDVFDEVNREIPIKYRRWVVQHIQFPSRENIEKCKALGLSVTSCTNFEWGKGKEVYLERLGKEYAKRAIPLRRWLYAGVPIAQSTDFGPYMPMFTLWQSLKRIHGLTGESYAGADQQISREEALRMYTIHGATVLFWENRIGSIEAGKLADLVVLDNDILTCPLDEIKDTGVLMTMVNGKPVHNITTDTY